eukprot:c4647_g1_i1.p1 GENE.c4647_g1_i1~~c4647_g1_i1.p1  ORF type:complete len:338 (+),score=87.99 c4647_g1_i1:82-1014(+)
MVGEGNILTLSDDCPIDQAVATLTAAKVQSAPVVRAGAPEGAEFDQKFLGYVDMFHLAGIVIKQAVNKGPVEGVEELLDEMETFHKATLREIGIPPLTPVSTDSTLLEAMIVMAKYQFRRIPIITTTADSFPGTLRNFLTPSFILATVADVCRKEKIDLSSFKVSDMRVKFGAVISVSDSASFLDALSQISEHSISAVPVVDQEGKLVYNLSATDVRRVIEFPILFEVIKRAEASVENFFTCLRESGLTVRTPITCRPDTSAQEVVDLMISNKIHRVYVVDEENRPIGVVSVVDVFSSLVVEPTSFSDNQ